MDSLKHVRPMRIQHYIYELSRDDRLADLPADVRLDDVNCRDAPTAIIDLGRSIKRSTRPINVAIEVNTESPGWFADDFFRTFGQELTGAVSVRTFHLDFRSRTSVVDAPFGDAELSHFVPFLTINTSLRSFCVDGAEIGNGGLRLLYNAMSYNRSLEKMIFRSCRNIDDESVAGLVEALRVCGTMNTLEFSGTGMSDAGTETICAYAAQSQFFKKLVLEGHPLNDAALGHLAALLKSPACNLEHLQIRSSNVGDIGTQKLAEALTTNRSLKSCILARCNNITDVGAYALIRSVYNSDSLGGVMNSNHTIRNLCFVHSGTSDEVRARDAAVRKLCHTGGEDEVVRKKIDNYLEKERGVTWDSIDDAVVDLDIKIMPHVLSLFGRKNGLSLLFETMRHWNMPALFVRYSFVAALEGQVKVLEEMLNIEKKRTEILHGALVLERKDNGRLRRRLGINDLKRTDVDEGCKVS